MKSRGCPEKAASDGRPDLPDVCTLDVRALTPPLVKTRPSARMPNAGTPMRLAHTDWLHHRLAITGTADQLAAFRHAAAGTEIIPRQIDLDRMEEDVFHLLVAPLQPRT